MESNSDKFKQMDRGFDLVQAIAEADRCLLCHDAPCSAGCPADTRPAEFIRKLRFKNITGAIRKQYPGRSLRGSMSDLPTVRGKVQCDVQVAKPPRGRRPPDPNWQDSAFLSRTFMGKKF